MTPGAPLSREMLRDPIDLRVEGTLDFSQAKSLARQKAGEIRDEPLLLAWFDRSRGLFSPHLTCCREEKPSWLTYAESRGGDLVICVNYLDYVFVFKGKSG